MPSKEPLWGIWIKRRADKNNWEIGFEYIIKVGKYHNPHQKNILFVTNAAFRSIVAKFPAICATQMGEVYITILHGKKKLITNKIDPFNSRTNPFFGFLTNIGLGTLIEKTIEKDLLQRFPDYKITSNTAISPWRINQLRARGRKAGESIPLKKALELSQAHVLRNARKNYRPQKWVH